MKKRLKIGMVLVQKNMVLVQKNMVLVQKNMVVEPFSHTAYGNGNINLHLYKEEVKTKMKTKLWAIRKKRIHRGLNETASQ